MKASQKRRIPIFALLLTVWITPGCSNSFLDDYGYLFGIALVGIFISLLISNKSHRTKSTSTDADTQYKVSDRSIPCENDCINVYKDKQLLKIGNKAYRFKEIKDFHVEKIKTLPDVANHLYTLSIHLKREKEAMQQIDLKIKEERAREMAGFLALLLVKKDFIFPGDASSSLLHRPEENDYTSRQYVKQSSEEERLAFEDEDLHEMWQQQEWEETQEEEEERLWRQEEEDYFYLQQQEEQEEEDWLYLQDEEDEP